MFNKRDKQGESFDTYLNSRCSLAKTSYFGELRDNLLRDRIVVGLLDNATRKKLFAEPKLTLDKCINICQANKTTTKQFKEITSDEIIKCCNYIASPGTARLGSPSNQIQVLS